MILHGSLKCEAPIEQSMTMDMSNNDRTMLKSMLTDPNRKWSINDLLESTGWDDQVHVAGSGQSLSELGLVAIHESKTRIVSLDSEGEKAAQNGLLEERIWKWYLDSDGDKRNMENLFDAGFQRNEAGPGIGLLKSMGVRLESGNLVAPDEELISSIISERRDFISKISASSVEDSELSPQLIEHFSGRKGLISIDVQVTRTWSLTEAGLSVDDELLSHVEMIGEVTPELLQGDSWMGAKFKPFDVNAPTVTPTGGRPHPMQALIERIRNVFLEMGFSEIEGNFVQSAGWNMDALYIPQSHPARTMQDTFYLSNPQKVEVQEEYLDLWSKVHEHGHDTGSRGWGRKFDREEAQKGLLRTHTTVNTVRHIAENPSKPSRVFGIGRVFRQETIDRTHLPEFHQIEGIIHEENANLPMLITTLKTFYSKMGYDDVRVRPAYFPYTEPSVEVDILWRGEWLELGGAGIFRPEVTEPLGTEWPVCAWGMGLERLAMLILGLDDIRQLYQPDLEKLGQMPIL